MEYQKMELYYETNDENEQYALIVAFCDHFYSIDDKQQPFYVDSMRQRYTPSQVRLQLIAKWQKKGWSDGRTKHNIRHLLGACQKIGFAKVKPGSKPRSYKFCAALRSKLLKSNQIIFPSQQVTVVSKPPKLPYLSSKGTNMPMPLFSLAVISDHNVNTKSSGGGKDPDNVDCSDHKGDRDDGRVIGNSDSDIDDDGSVEDDRIEDSNDADTSNGDVDDEDEDDVSDKSRQAASLLKETYKTTEVELESKAETVPDSKDDLPVDTPNVPRLEEPTKIVSPASTTHRPNLSATLQLPFIPPMVDPVPCGIPPPPGYTDIRFENAQTDTQDNDTKQQLASIMHQLQEMQQWQAQNESLTTELSQMRQRMDKIEHGADRAFREWTTQQEKHVNDQIQTWEKNLNKLLVDQIQDMRVVMLNHLTRHNGHFNGFVRQTAVTAKQDIQDAKMSALGSIYEQTDKIKEDCVYEINASAQSLVNNISAQALKDISQQKQALFDEWTAQIQLQSSSSHASSSITPFSATSNETGIESPTLSSHKPIFSNQLITRPQELPLLAPKQQEQAEFDPLQAILASIASQDRFGAVHSSNAATQESSKPFFPLQPPDTSRTKDLLSDKSWLEHMYSPFQPKRTTLLGRITGIRLFGIGSKTAFIDLAPPERNGNRSKDDLPWRSGVDGEAMAVQLIAGESLYYSLSDFETTMKLKQLTVGTLVLVDVKTNVENPDCFMNWIEKRRLDLSVLGLQMVAEIKPGINAAG